MRVITQPKNFINHTKYLAFKDLVRSFLIGKKYTEVSVPTLSPVIIPETHAGIYTTDNQYAGGTDLLYLTPHPELFLKRLISEQTPQVFTLSHAYRNHESNTRLHSPEFEMVEFYSTHLDYITLQQEVLELLQYCAEQWYGKTELVYQGKPITFDTLEVITMQEAFSKYTGINNLLDHTIFFKQAEEQGYTTDGFSYIEVFSQIVSDKIEPNIGSNGKATLMIDYPPELAATSRINKATGWAEKWELYIAGIELGNAANEDSNLSIDELNRYYETILVEREKSDIGAITRDLEFINILPHLPACAGIGIGLNRLAMIFCDLDDIRDLQVTWVE